MSTHVYCVIIYKYIYKINYLLIWLNQLIVVVFTVSFLRKRRRNLHYCTHICIERNVCVRGLEWTLLRATACVWMQSLMSSVFHPGLHGAAVMSLLLLLNPTLTSVCTVCWGCKQLLISNSCTLHTHTHTHPVTPSPPPYPVCDRRDPPAIFRHYRHLWPDNVCRQYHWPLTQSLTRSAE